MEELSDKDFDQIFKNKIKEGYLKYEEESWLKMEKKLRKRDRFLFLRTASILLVFLSIGIGIYLMMDKKLPYSDLKSAKKIEKQVEKGAQIASHSKKDERSLTKIDSKNMFLTSRPKVRHELSFKSNTFETKKQDSLVSETQITNQTLANDPSTAIVQSQVVPQNKAIPEGKNAERIIDVDRGKLMARRSVAFSINIGPDFNSTENAIGGKGGLALGIGINVSINNRLSLQSGINYGSKNYDAQGYDYAFNNPNTVYSIEGIEASCKVLELPFRASYIIGGTSGNTISANAGLSSYIMLKEKYRFIYTPTSGRKDRFLEEKNANQHYLSVIDLSATYTIKLKNQKFAFGVEPYVKIPVNGIGEGKVPLKSSGISLKLNYELRKK